MATPPDQRFGNAFNSLVARGDTRGTGQSAPSGSGQQAAFNSAIQENREDFQLPGDLQSPAERQQALLAELSQEKPKSFLDKYVLGGNRWGVYNIGGVKMVNPVKTVFSGLDTVQEEFVSPITGYAIGNGAQSLAMITNWSSAGKIAEDFRKKMDAVDGGFWETRTALKEFNEERDALFWGEKFISSMIFDPTSYVGFGWAMKMPKLFGATQKLGIAGKQIPVLGPLEKGWIDMWNFPFTVGSRAYRGETLFKIPSYLNLGVARVPLKKLGGGTLVPGGPGVPLSGSQKAAAHANKVFDDSSEFMRQASGKNIETITKADIQGAMAEVLDPAVHYNLLPSNEARRMRDILWENPKVTGLAAERLIQDVGGTTQVARFGKLAGKSDNPAVKEVVQYLQQNGSSLADDVGARYAMSDVRDWFVSGRLNLDEASEQLARIAGAPINEASQKTFNNWLKGTARATHSRAQALVNDDHPRGIIEQLRSQAQKNFKADSEHGFHERMQQLTSIGAMISKGDSLQKALYQRGLKKWVIQPMAKLVLTFPLFPIQERMETMIRTGLGQGRLGLRTRNVARYNKNVAGNWNVPSSLSREGKNIAGQRAAVNRQSALADPDAPFGDKALFESIARRLVGNKLVNNTSEIANNKWYGGAMKWLNPDHWNAQANQWSADGRRMYHEHAVIKEHVSLYANDEALRPMRDFLASGSQALPKEVSDDLVNHMATAGLTGRGDAVRALAEDWTGEVIQKVEIEKLVDARFSANELHPSSRDFITEWENAGARTSSVDRVIKQIEDNEFDAFAQGLGGFEVQLDLSMGQVGEALDMLKGIPLAERTADDILMAEGAVKAGLQAVDGIDKRISQTLSRATQRARETAFNNTKREEIIRTSEKSVNATMNRMLERKAEYMGQLKALEMEAFDGKVVGLAAAGEKKLDITIAGWRQDRAAVSGHFAEWEGKTKTQGFYDELGRIREEIQTTMRQSQFEADAVLENTVRRARQKRGITVPEPDFQKMSDDLAKKTTYSIDDLANVVGQNAENVTQAMMQAVWLNKDDFTNYFMIRGADNGIKGLDPAKIGDVYKRVQKQFAISDKVGMHFMQTKHNLRQFGDDLKNAAKAPAFRPEQETATKNFIEGFASLVDGQADDLKTHMRTQGQQGVDNATEQTNRAFVNYDGQTAVDQTMQSLFPFWTYESRRMPFLLRTAGTNPIVWQTFGAEGNYWEATDDGYIHPAVAPWMDVNVFGGTLLNAPRRLKKGDMPPEHEGGIRGAISSAEQQMAQGGFYFGAHMTFAFDAILQGDLTEAAGQSAPPPLTGGLAAAQWVAETANLPVIPDALRKMRTAVLPDKFRDYEAAKIIWDMGLNPAHVDFDKWEPRPGKENFVSQDQINEALRRSAGVEWIREISGMVRFRGDAEREYRAARDEIQMEWTGLTKAELDEARRQGIPLTSIVPMPPKVGRILQELEGGEQFNASVALLSSGEKARIQELSREMWETYDSLKVQADAEQAEDDRKWLSGEIGASVWRDNMSSRKQSIGGFIDQIRGFKRDPVTGEKIDINPAARYREVPTTFEEYGELQKKLGNDTIRIQHPTSQALEMYHSIAPVDRDGDGVPEWNEFFKARESLLGQLPTELRREVMSEIEEKQTEAERELGRMQRGILGDYWNVDEQVKEEMGIQDLVESLMLAERTDPLTAEALRRLPAMSRYRKEVQRRKDLLRLQSPELDYALNIFGFTGKTLRFKNPQSRLWWERGNGVQRQVPFFGYLTGNEAPQ